MSTDFQKETLGFQTEVSQLLHLMIHSLYSNKEIFLRELISNASDAIDRLRFAALSDNTLLDEGSDYEIYVNFDKEAHTITVTDNGIGMTREEVIQNIGTIAKSGTKEFLKILSEQQQKDANLIGQFGVGFYSSFIVAQDVILETRRAGASADECVRWESNGEGTYTIETIAKSARGTSVTLVLRDDEYDLLDAMRLRQIIRTYSDHISVPIMMAVEAAEPAEESTDEVIVDDHSAAFERVNQAAALWARPKSEISDEEYHEFYRHLTYDFEDPMATIHSRMEGTYEYLMLLFIPKRAPFDMWNREKREGIKLYVRRIFIMDDAENIMPRYLRFIRGVIDSNDLPLNISREILQKNRVIDTIRANAVKKVLSELADMSENRSEDYAAFWSTFGQVLKEGLLEDRPNTEALLNLCRFASTNTDTEAQVVSLKDYIGRMKEGQDSIYFITGETFQTAKNSPHLEIFRQKGIEVLLLSEPVDFLISSEWSEFEEHKFQSISRGEVDLSKVAGDETETTDKPDQATTEKLVERIKSALGEQVQSVRISTRLTNSPACLVYEQGTLDPNFVRLLKASGQKAPAMKPILEINAGHAILRRMEHEGDTTAFAKWASILYDQSLLSMGEQLEDPAHFVATLNELLAHS